ncbi:MAG TPA: hypothetical protein VNN08_16900 [Thermoanaerobaculia bacterium]|nr:hypothetical protein [Thermoanaerobaculia bacterium]
MNSINPVLLVAHPGHELLLYGWLRSAQPVVHVLTDGSGHSSISRLPATADLLRETGALPGSIFGRLSDREAYAMIREQNMTLLRSIVDDLAEELVRRRTSTVVCDAAEGYNPVHDLCRLIAGAAIAAAGTETALYEYAVVGRPDVFDEGVPLDEATFAAKMEAARRSAPAISDVSELLRRHGSDAYRTESFQSVTDWTSLHPNECPDYERYGQERVASHRYERVIRRAEHMIPLRDALWAWTESGQFVS